jgi:hypothetical protein
VEVIKHAFLPAIISYVALVYIVHLEACKLGLKALEKPVTKTFRQSVISFVLTFLFIVIMGGITYYGLGWIKTVAGKATIYVVCVLLFGSYLLLLKFACQVPELDTTTEIDVLPELGPTAQAGILFSVAHRGADVVPGGGTAFASPVSLLGHSAVNVHRPHPAPPQRASFAKCKATTSASRPDSTILSPDLSTAPEI